MLVFMLWVHYWQKTRLMYESLGSPARIWRKLFRTGLIDRDLAKHFTELFEKRQKGDYNDFFDYDEETVLRLYPVSQRFIAEITNILNS